MKNYDDLVSEGLTNKDAADLSQMAGQKIVIYEARCSSKVCCRKVYTKSTRDPREGAYIVKKVGKNTDWCPDCGHAILWVKMKIDVGSERL